MNELNGNDPGSPDLDPLAARLRRERPTATPLELDRIKLEARRRADRPARHAPLIPKGAPMKSRIAVTAILVVGALMSGTGATLAISGPNGVGVNAAQSQYSKTTTTTTTTGVAGQTDSGEPGGAGANGASPGGDDPGGSGGVGGVSGSSEPTVGSGSVDSAPASDVQASRQEGSDGGRELPFTGFAALPVLLTGVLLMISGVVLRRRLPA